MRLSITLNVVMLRFKSKSFKIQNIGYQTIIRTGNSIQHPYY